jgi:hypothetical protein
VLQLLCEDLVMSRKRRALLACLIVLAVAAVVVADKAFGLTIGATVAGFAAVALLWVTWLYVETTRNYTLSTKTLVEIQSNQSKAQLLQSHYAAAAAMWSTCGALNEVNMSIRSDSEDLSKLTSGGDAVALQKTFEAHANELRTQSDLVVNRLIDLEGPLERQAWKIASSALAMSTHLLTVGGFLLDETLRAKRAGDPFRLSEVVAAWEAQGSEPELPRWSDLVSGAWIEPFDSAVDAFALDCRAEVRRRAAGAS